MRRALTPAVLLALYLLHFDFWLWNRIDRVLGLPVGLFYHLIYCLAVALALGLLLRTTDGGTARHG